MKLQHNNSLVATGKNEPYFQYRLPSKALIFQAFYFRFPCSTALPLGISMKLIHLILLFIVFVNGTVAHAENNNVTGLFSTFRVSEKSGDISGAEIHIVPNPVGYSAIVQASEGAPAFPEVIKISVKGSEFEFTIPENSASGFSPGKYQGSVSIKGLMLHGPKGLYKEYFLPRRNSFWK